MKSKISLLPKSILIDFDPILEDLNRDIECYDSLIDTDNLMSIGIVSATKRLSKCDDMDIDFNISEWIRSLLYFNNHWDAEEKNVNKLKRLIYILMSRIEEYLLQAFELQNMPVDVYYAYPVRLGIYILIPEDGHDETIPYILGSVFRSS